MLPAEFDLFWQKAPKFPDGSERIDVDSFVQLYRDIDDLFEEEEDGDAAKAPTKEPVSEEPPEDSVEAELEDAFAALADSDGLVSQDAVRAWDEVKTLLEDGLLGSDELETLWAETPKRPGTDKVDVEGFLSFTVALDDLFDLEEDDDEDEVERDYSPVSGEGLTPQELFAKLSVDGETVDTIGLKRWAELDEMIVNEEILVTELQEILDSVPSSPDNPDLLDEAGFLAFYEAIDDLFEDVDDDEEEVAPTAASSAVDSAALKEDLLDLLEDLNTDEDRLPCGLEADEQEQDAIQELVEALERTSTNQIREKQGEISRDDLAGTWELLYSSSSAMKFNKGLSGLGGSFPNGRFAGVKQVLKANKYMTDVEYLERIEVNPSSASFDVKVTGDWELRRSVSLFTGEPSTVLTVVPERVTYGPTSTRADHWKSLGPLNMLDVTYLDEDLRVMRGNTAVDTIFIFRRAD